MSQKDANKLKVQLPHKVQFEMDAEIFNALNAINFNGNLNPGSGATIFRVTSQGSQLKAGAGRTGQVCRGQTPLESRPGLADISN